jgi:hypothetical protein
MKKLLTLLAGSTLAFYMQGCSDNGTSANDDNPLSKGSVYVYTSDYKSQSGELRWIDEDGKLSEKSLEFNQDSKIVSANGKLFVLERFGADNLALVDPEENKTKWQKKLDANANPSDVVKANDNEVWVALDGAAKFIKVSVEDGEITKTVKTKDFCEGDACTPNLVDFEVSGDTLFALFQRLANYTYVNKGLLAMYKLSNGELLDTITLAKKNPIAMAFAKGKLYVASTGVYGNDYETYASWTDADDARGIEVVDLSKKKSSMVVDGEKLGGGVTAFAVDSKNGIAYAAIYKDSKGNVPLVEVDLEKKSVKTIKGVSDVEGSLFFDEKSGVLYIGDRKSGESAVYTYEDGEVTKIETATEDVLPIYNITVVR